MIKFLLITLIITAIFLLSIAIINVYKIKYAVNNITNKNSYNFVLLNIIIAATFIFFYIIFISLIIKDNYYLGVFFASFLFLLSSIFIFIASIVTSRMGQILYKLDTKVKLDPLTNSYNKKYLEIITKKLFKQCFSEKIDASIAIIDIDNLNKVNNTYGRQLGDALLIDLSKIMSVECEDINIFGRYYEDEFMIIMPKIDISQANFLINSISNIVNNRCVEKLGHQIKYSISYGISRFNPSLLDHEEWIKSAYANLNKTKHKKNSD